MSISCTRRLQWAMGHRVYGHENKCGHAHGHNFIGRFTATSSSLDRQGRVIDFSQLKSLIGGWIDDRWDHGFVLWSEDPMGTAFRRMKGSNGEPQKLFILPYNPTAENLAKYLGEVICPDLFKDSGITITRIVIEETENGAAEWKSDVQGV